MIFKLRNGVITVTHNNITEPAKRTHIRYDYEFGTNHLVPILVVNNKEQYKGDNVEVNFDLPNEEVILDVYLHDKYNNIIKRYHSVYICHKMCTIGTKQFVDIYNELERLTKENESLKEKGEVI